MTIRDAGIEAQHQFNAWLFNDKGIYLGHFREMSGEAQRALREEFSGVRPEFSGMPAGVPTIKESLIVRNEPARIHFDCWLAEIGIDTEAFRAMARADQDPIRIRYSRDVPWQLFATAPTEETCPERMNP